MTPDRLHAHCWRVLGLLLAACMVGPLEAADSAASNGTDAGATTLQEVVVTASKRTENIQEVPTAISVLSSDTLVQQGVEEFSDYMPLVPGLEQSAAGVAGHGLVIMRGLSTGSQQTASTVAFLIDDIPFTPNSSLAIGSLLTPDPDLADVERIEVLKGPQGTLYGASALGGIIKIVSTPPNLETFSGEARVTGSSVDHGGDGFGARGSLNIPLITDVMALRVSAFDRTDPGFVSNVELGINDANKTEVSGGKAVLRIAPASNLDIELNGMVQNLYAYGTASVDTDAITMAPLECRYCYANAIGPLYSTGYRLAGMVVNWTLPTGTLTNSLSYGQYKDSEIFDYSQYYGVVNELLGITAPPGTKQISFLRPSMRKLAEELRFATGRLGNFEGLGGFFFTHEHNEYDVGLDNDGPPPTFTPLPAPYGLLLRSFSKPLYTEYAGFADLTYYFLPNLDVTAGGRYTHNSQVDTQIGYGLLQGNTNRDFHSSEHPTTYLATLRYRPTAFLDTYARVATGYRPGGPQTLVSSNANVPTSFKPDTTRNWELGVKGRWLDNTLTTNVAAYYIQWQDVQINELIGGLQVQGNGGKATSKGLEFDVAYLPFKGLTTEVSASFNHAYTNVAVPTVGALAGDTLPYAARFTGSFTADYVFPITTIFNGDAGLTYAYQGGRPTSWSEDPLNLPFNLPGYGTLALRTGVTWGQYSLRLRAENITNKYAYTTSGVGNIFPGQGAPASAVVIQPRTLFLDLNVKF